MKKIILLSLTLVLYLVALGFYTNYKLDTNKKESYLKLSKILLDELNIQKQFSRDKGTMNAITVAEDIVIHNALLQNNRKPAIVLLEKLKKDYGEKTSIKDLKIHIHTKDTKSFIRSWKLNKYGDDLSGFRKAIVRVEITKELFFGFEVGRMGLTLRSIVPIIHNKELIGSLEYIQNFDNIVKIFDRKNYSYVLLMDKSLLKIAKYLKDAPKVGPYILSSRDYNKNFLTSAQFVDFEKLEADGYYLGEKYFYTYEDIKDTDNANVGLHLLAMPAEVVREEIASNEKELYMSIAINTFILLLSIGTMFVLYILISSSRETGKRH